MELPPSFKALVENLYHSSHANIRDEFADRLAGICIDAKLEPETYLQLVNLCVDLVNTSYRKGADDLLQAVFLDMNNLRDWMKQRK